MRGMSESPAERDLRKKCEHRLVGVGAIVRRLRVSENPDDIADAAWLLGTMDDLADYVGVLRGIEE